MATETEEEQWIVCAVPAVEEEEGMFVFLNLTKGNRLRGRTGGAKSVSKSDDVSVVDPAAARFVLFESADDLLEEGLLDRSAVKWRFYDGLDTASPTDLTAELNLQAGFIRETTRYEFFFRQVLSWSNVTNHPDSFGEWQALPSLAKSRWTAPDRLPSSAVEEEADEESDEE